MEEQRNIPMKKWPFIVANLSWLIGLFTFIFCLGGIHPSDRFRDQIITVSACFVMGLNLPLLVQLVYLIIQKIPFKLLLRSFFFLVARLGVLAWLLSFIHGISHEHKHSFSQIKNNSSQLLADTIASDIDN